MRTAKHKPLILLLLPRAPDTPHRRESDAAVKFLTKPAFPGAYDKMVGKCGDCFSS